MKNTFRIIAFTEGISYLLLLYVSDPLKYWGRNDDLVSSLGMMHGLLFIAYIILAFFMKSKEEWNVKDLSIVTIASLIPVGTFYIDWKYLKNKN
jgi:integral membrane protein